MSRNSMVQKFICLWRSVIEGPIFMPPISACQIFGYLASAVKYLPTDKIIGKMTSSELVAIVIFLTQKKDGPSEAAWIDNFSLTYYCMILYYFATVSLAWRNFILNLSGDVVQRATKDSILSLGNALGAFDGRCGCLVCCLMPQVYPLLTILPSPIYITITNCESHGPTGVTMRNTHHMELRDKFVREWVQYPSIPVSHVVGKRNYIDLLMKETKYAAHYRYFRDSFVSSHANFLCNSLVISYCNHHSSKWPNSSRHSSSHQNGLPVSFCFLSLPFKQYHHPYYYSAFQLHLCFCWHLHNYFFKCSNGMH